MFVKFIQVVVSSFSVFSYLHNACVYLFEWVLNGMIHGSVSIEHSVRYFHVVSIYYSSSVLLLMDMSFFQFWAIIDSDAYEHSCTGLLVHMCRHFSCVCVPECHRWVTGHKHLQL